MKPKTTDTNHMIRGSRWWLMGCFELKELIVIISQNSNISNGSRLSNDNNSRMLLLFSCFCTTISFNMAVAVAIVATNTITTTASTPSPNDSPSLASHYNGRGGRFLFFVTKKRREMLTSKTLFKTVKWQL